MCVLLVVGDCVGARKKGNHQHKDRSHPAYEYIIPFSEHTHNIYFIHENSCFIAEHEQPFSNHCFLCICFALFHALHVKRYVRCWIRLNQIYYSCVINYFEFAKVSSVSSTFFFSSHRKYFPPWTSYTPKEIVCLQHPEGITLTGIINPVWQE